MTRTEKIFVGLVRALLSERRTLRAGAVLDVGAHRGETACVAYDFLPIEPTSPATAATLLSGGAVRGDRRVRALSRVPSRRCWRVGDTTPGLGGGGAAGVDAVARAFQSTYDASLRLRENGCREHTAAMALAMTGITLDLDALLIEGDANRSDDDA